MAGNIDVEGDFKELMHLRTLPAFQNLKFSFGTKLGMLFQYPKTLNPLMQSPKNISYHDDRGNDFCRLCLEESMTYSCAYFRDESDTLEQAQQQKYEHICRKLQLQPGDALVGIGCGWGDHQSHQPHTLGAILFGIVTKPFNTNGSVRINHCAIPALISYLEISSSILYLRQTQATLN